MSTKEKLIGIEMQTVRFEGLAYRLCIVDGAVAWAFAKNADGRGLGTILNPCTSDRLAERYEQHRPGSIARAERFFRDGELVSREFY